MPASTAPVTSDFRDAAVAESERLLAERAREEGRAFAEPMEAGISYCLRAEGEGASALRRFKWKTLGSMALGVGGLIGGAVLAARAESGEGDAAVLPLAVACSLGGFFFLFFGATLQGRVVRRVARDRITTEREGASKPLVMSVEDGRSFKKMKAVPEDVGAVILHESSRCMQIEGLTHRYLIYGDDVFEMEVEKTPSSEALVIQYGIGDESLRIALFHHGLGAEFKRQTIGGRNKVFERIRKSVLP